MIQSTDNGVDFEMEQLLFQERRNACINRIKEGFKKVEEKYNLTDEEKEPDDQELANKRKEWDSFQKQRQREYKYLNGRI